MKVKWTKHAKGQQKQIADYIRTGFGISSARKFKQEVERTTSLLGLHPNMGSIDPLYADRPIAYRSIIVNGLSKLVYRIDDDAIRIVGFWDCRQEPQSQAAKTE